MTNFRAVLGVILMAGYLALPAWASQQEHQRQNRQRQQDPPPPTAVVKGIINDWSNHHLIFSRPSSPAVLNKVQRDPRYLIQQMSRNRQTPVCSAEQQIQALNAKSCLARAFVGPSCNLQADRIERGVRARPSVQPRAEQPIQNLSGAVCRNPASRSCANDLFSGFCPKCVDDLTFMESSSDSAFRISCTYFTRFHLQIDLALPYRKAPYWTRRGGFQTSHGQNGARHRISPPPFPGAAGMSYVFALLIRA